MPTLFDELNLGDLTLKNRVLMAPLTRNRAEPDGTPGELAKTYYRQRASAGLIFTEATQISARGKGYINTPGIYEQSHVQAWKEITQQVHEEGGRIFLQLWHVGRISHTSLLPDGEQPVAPSAIRADSKTHTENGEQPVSEPRALATDEVVDTANEFGHAAACAEEAGFDGVEIHAANGYLIDQFLRDKTNKRQDRYGGSIENRARFLLEVIEAVKKSWPAGRIGVRLAPTGSFNDMGDSNPLEHFSYVIEQLNQLSLAYLHIVERFPGMSPKNEDLNVICKLIARWKGCYIGNGNYDYLKAKDAIESGRADAITFGRPFLANPDLPKRFRLGAELNEPDQDTFYGGGAEGYTDYPFLEE